MPTARGRSETGKTNRRGWFCQRPGQNEGQFVTERDGFDLSHREGDVQLLLSKQKEKDEEAETLSVLKEGVQVLLSRQRQEAYT